MTDGSGVVRFPQTKVAAIFAVGLLVFGVSATDFVVRVTDISAMRVLDGDVPYRDFWTMYAPGSFVTLALVFSVFGVQLLISNVLGNVTAAAGVAVYLTLVGRVTSQKTALAFAALVMSAFAGTGYANGFTSFAPTFLLVGWATRLVTDRITDPGRHWTVAPGLVLGIATLYKHDVAGYAAIALGIALWIVRRRQRLPAAGPAAVMAASLVLLPATAVMVLVVVGAGPELWRDLVVFPLTDFRHVRPEYFPLIPAWRDNGLDMARELVRWIICTMPLAVVAIGNLAWWRRAREASPGETLLLITSTIAFAFHWSAAHVQLNTNAISLPAWAALAATAGLGRTGWQGGAPALRRLVMGCLLLWIAVYPMNRLHDVLVTFGTARTSIGLPRLAGIRTTVDEAGDLRALAAAIAESEPPEAPLLFVSARNDIQIFAESVPFWLSSRRPAVRFHEMHPGITDTEIGQRQMIAALERSIAPVVVRERRFTDVDLDDAKRRLTGRVSIGATRVDDWIADRYGPGLVAGRYEVLRRRSRAVAAPSLD